MTTEPITDRNSAVCNADSEQPSTEHVTSDFTLASLQSALTDRGWWARVWRRAVDLLHPPAVLAAQAPAVAQLRRYAHEARWTTSSRGPVRAAGVAWCYLVAIPVTVGARYWEWMWQRPARALVVLATLKALTLLPPVGWAVDHLIVPTINAAVAAFL